MVQFASQLGDTIVPGAAQALSDKCKALRKPAHCSYDIVESSEITIYQHVQDLLLLGDGFHGQGYEGEDGTS